MVCIGFGLICVCLTLPVVATMPFNFSNVLVDEWQWCLAMSVLSVSEKSFPFVG